MISATLNLYRDAGSDAFASIRRSLWAIAFLLAGFVLMFASGLALGPAGFAGGFVLFLVHAGLTGWYLSLVEIAVATRRSISTQDIRDNVGQYFNDIITVMFIFFLPELLIGLAYEEALWVLIPAACLAFNPIPEMLYQERAGGLELIRDSAMFMQQNWPEWIGPHLVAGGLLATLGWSITGIWDPEWMVEAVKMFGPWFGFMQSGYWGLSLGGSFTPQGMGLFALLFVFSHCFMVFRGHLYKRLRTSSRRGRAWKAQL